MKSTTQHPINLPKGIYFIGGIDTDIGKTYATGHIAQCCLKNQQHIITQKLIQTGCQHESEDILIHRKIMGINQTEADKQMLTAPQILEYPASPHLAAKLENKHIDLEEIKQASMKLAQNYDIVLIEGAGGLMTPLNQELTTLDYIAQQNYPIILVTSSKLGSINHTLLNLHAIKQYQLNLYALAFNSIHDQQNTVIANDTRQFLQHYLTHHFPKAQWWEIPILLSLHFESGQGIA